jgi:hypothetical protein
MILILQKLAVIFILAVVIAAIIALPLSMFPALLPQRKHFSERFSYAFVNWGLPACCAVELVFWLITKRWIPWFS